MGPMTDDRAIRAADPVVAEILAREADRRRSTLDLIASESVPSAAVLAVQASLASAKTAEGYPGARYHTGTAIVDDLERLAIERARELFGAEHANVQPNSGVNANLAVYAALLKPGDPVLAMDLAHGGHLSHGASASITGKLYRFRHYGVSRATERIDLDEVRALALEHRPRLLVAGGSSYPRNIDYAGFRAIADEVGALLLVDMAHIAGLVAAGILPSPVPHADAVTFTTYKTMLGPHGGIILSRAPLAARIDRGVFPGTQGTPSFGMMAAKAVCLGAAGTVPFRERMRLIVDDAAAFATALDARGYRLVAGGTDTHLVLLDLRSVGLTGDVAERALEAGGILANRNVIPFDPEGPRRPCGLRLGLTGLADRGMGPALMPVVAELVDRVLRAPGDPGIRAAVAAAVEDLTRRHPIETDG
jgi:glycine hydroxymethyltransferase